MLSESTGSRIGNRRRRSETIWGPFVGIRRVGDAARSAAGASESDGAVNGGPLSDGAGIAPASPGGAGNQAGAPGTPAFQVIVAVDRPTSADGLAAAVNSGGATTATLTSASPTPPLVGLISMLARPVASVGTSTRLPPAEPSAAVGLATS